MKDTRDLAERLTYRPGWYFDGGGGGVIRICFVVPNTVDPDSYVSLEATVDVDGLDELDAIRAVWAKLEGIDRHERAEWLRLDGMCMHAEARRAHPGWPVATHPAAITD